MSYIATLRSVNLAFSRFARELSVFYKQLFLQHLLEKCLHIIVLFVNVGIILDINNCAWPFRSCLNEGGEQQTGREP